MRWKGEGLAADASVCTMEDRTMHSSVTGYMLTELMTGEAPVMPTETTIATWTVLPWKEEMSREELLAVRIRQLEGRAEDIAEAIR